MTPPAQPIRGDLYCAKRLEQFATELASTHRISPGRRRGRALLARQRDNRRTLHRALKSIALDVKHDRAISPAAQWFVDNYSLLEEQLREVEQDLPPGYYLELPKLADGDHAGRPRVVALVWGYVELSFPRFRGHLPSVE